MNAYFGVGDNSKKHADNLYQVNFTKTLISLNNPVVYGKTLTINVIILEE